MSPGFQIEGEHYHFREITELFYYQSKPRSDHIRLHNYAGENPMWLDLVKSSIANLGFI